jgi:hypothetical protein
MASLSDELLLENEISFVNRVWEKVNNQRSLRNLEVNNLRESFDNLKIFQ